jgi:pyridoxine 5-phosphate synthase
MNPLVAPFAHEGHRAARTALSVNVNKVAALRNLRALDIPNVAAASRWALEAGAQGITIHPRPDERHIRERDVHELAALMQRWPEAEFNLEGNPFHNLMPLVRAVRPAQATFVPDSSEQSTSDHGWDLAADGEPLRPLIAECRALGVRVSLFMDADGAAMAVARELGADRIELYTEPWAAAFGTAQQAAQLERFASAAQAAQALGLGVNAGHDLNRDNLAPFLRGVPGVLEVSIGHALIGDCIELGMAATVKAYLACIRDAHSAAMAG